MGDTYSTTNLGSGWEDDAPTWAETPGLIALQDVEGDEIDDADLSHQEAVYLADRVRKRRVRQINAAGYLRLATSDHQAKKARSGGKVKKFKTNAFASATNNILHAAVFGKMRVPVYVKKTSGKKFRGENAGSGRAATGDFTASVPMSAENPVGSHLFLSSLHLFQFQQSTIRPSSPS